MYAVIKTGGKQYKVQKDLILTVEKLCNILNCTPNDVFAFKDEKDL